MIYIKSPSEIKRMREGGKILAGALRVAGEIIKPGITTLEIDQAILVELKRHDAEAAFKDYQGFPANACISVNEEVVHGIPSQKRKLVSGDIVGVDIGVRFKDVYTDACRTFAVGDISEDLKKLMQVAEKSLELGTATIKPGSTTGDIGQAVQTYAESMGFYVVRDLVGHGVGKKIHEPPQIPNFGMAGTGDTLVANMTIAIEPMINMGTYKVETLDDGWTVATKDKKPSAHYENTILITETGFEILTTLR